MWTPVVLCCALWAVSVPQEGAQAPAAAPVAGQTGLALSLTDAVRTALSNDLSLKVEEVAAEVSEFSFEGTWGRFDPSLRANASFADVENPNNSPFIPVSSITTQQWQFDTGINLPLLTGGAFDLSIAQTSTDTNFATIPRSVSDVIALTFNQPLLRGAGTGYSTSNSRESELRYRRQLERVRQVRQDLIKRVADAYWDLVTAREQLGVADETLALAREQLEQNQRRLQLGAGTEVEVLQADTNVAQRIEQRLAREVAVRAAADRLKGLMHPGTDAAKWDAEYSPSSQLPALRAEEIPSWGAAFAVALAERPELRQQLFLIDEAEERLLRAGNERRSQLDFVFTTSSQAIERNEGDAFSSAAQWEFPTYQASLNFSTPIGNRTALYAEKSARAGVRSARLGYEQVESTIVEEVRAAVRNTLYSIEAVRAAEASAELGRRQLAAEQARYREGLSTTFQVLQFQQQLAESLYSQTLARANLAKAFVALRRAQGVLDEEHVEGR